MAILQAYGRLKDKRRVQQVLLRNKNGLEVACIPLGCRLTNILVPTGRSKKVDILLGYDKLSSYAADTDLHGALLGRYAGRIRGATFELEGKSHALTPNAKPDFIHGTLANRLFTPQVIGDNSVLFTATSPEGEDGFPGEVRLFITYTLTETNELIMDYRATTTQLTHLNLSNHSYFNLAGNQAGSIASQELWLNSAFFLEMDERLCPTGRVLPVTGNPAFDFRTAKPIGRDIVARDHQLYNAKGYDHCFVLEKTRPGALNLAAALKEPVSGRVMRLYTTQPGLVVYTANGFNGTGLPGKGDQPYMRRGGLSLEAAHWPDSPHFPDFPRTTLDRREDYHETTVLEFDWQV